VPLIGQRRELTEEEIAEAEERNLRQKIRNGLERMSEGMYVHSAVRLLLRHEQDQDDVELEDGLVWLARKSMRAAKVYFEALDIVKFREEDDGGDDNETGSPGET
jgi:hypothetical protein